MNAQQAYNEITAHIEKQGGPHKNWYAGIASDAKKRLFEEHNVSEKDGWWIYKNCDSEQAARNAEEALLKFGCDGDMGGGDSSTTFAYAYLKTNNTTP